MAKAFSEAMPAAEVAEVDRLARKLWRYGEESYSNAWLRAYIKLFHRQMRIWDGRIKEGRIELEDREGFHALIKSLEGKEVQLTLERFRMKRSNPQNRWYWGVIVALLAEHCGYEPEEMHEALKAKFLRDRAEEEIGGLPKIRSSAGLDTVGFSEYCEKCRQLAAELGVYVPSPEEF